MLERQKEKNSSKNLDADFAVIVDQQQNQLTN